MAKLSQRGIPVFNAPGANANAVKELVLAGLFLAARNICQAWELRRARWTATITRSKSRWSRARRSSSAIELPGRTLGVVGLGAIGVEVANAALELGMKVLGYDPQITVQRAWQLSSGVEQALSLDDLFARCDSVTVHVPLNDQTRGLVNAARIALMRKGGAVLNFARGADRRRTGRRCGDSTAGSSRAYVCDFPTNAMPITIRAWSRCRTWAPRPARPRKTAPIMVADTLRDFLESGNVPQLGQLSRGRPAAQPASAGWRSRTPTFRTWSARSRPPWRRPASISPTC